MAARGRDPRAVDVVVHIGACPGGLFGIVVLQTAGGSDALVPVAGRPERICIAKGTSG
jgi:hypothetical protein